METIEQVNIKEPKQDKRGKTYWSIGLKINGEWRNNPCYEPETVEKFRLVKAGDKMDLVLSESPKEGGGVWLNWKLPSKVDLLEAELKETRELINTLIKLNNLKWKE